LSETNKFFKSVKIHEAFIHLTLFDNEEEEEEEEEEKVLFTTYPSHISSSSAAVSLRKCNYIYNLFTYI